MEGTELNDRDFYRCTFQNLRFQDRPWRGAKLEECVFQDCDFTQLKLDKVGLRGVRFVGCKLMGIDWTPVSPNPEVTFERCMLRYSSFTSINLRSASFLECNLTETNFIEADLTKVDFARSDLSAASLRDCVLVEARFAEAKGVYFDTAINRTRGACISIETAILLARGAGLKVAGYDDEPTAKGAGRRRR